jgi:O-antigen/teichoic acid export membrane protein
MASRLLNLILTNALFVYFLTHGYGVLAMAFIVLVVDQISNCLYFLIARRLFKQLRISTHYFSRALIRELFTFSSWAFLIQLANQVRFRIDASVVGWLLGASFVVQYTIGARLVEYFVDLVYRATNLMMPLFTMYYVQNDMDALRSKFLLFTRMNAAIAIFGGGVVVALGRLFIRRWMGEGYDASYDVLVILMAAMVIEVIGNYADNVLYAMNKHHRLAVIAATEAVLNFGLSLYFASHFGLAGVAMGTALPLLFFRLFVIPRTVCRALSMRMRSYYFALLPTAVVALAHVLALVLVLRDMDFEPSYPVIIAAGLLTSVVYCLVAPFALLSRDERILLLRPLLLRARRLIGFEMSN